MRSDDVIYIDLESYKGFYNDIGKDDVYKVSAKSGVLPGLYKFVEDESGDTCESCALCGVKDQCQTCFECYNLSAKKIEDEENPVENPSENKNAQKAWEAELKEIESQITSLEEVIDDKASELKDLKKNREALYDRLKGIVALGSKGYAESHPLFNEIEEVEE